MGNKFDTIIFDLDGTLFQTDKLVINSFKSTFSQLEEKGLAIDLPSDTKLLSVIGMTPDKIWPELVPGISEKEITLANNYMLENELLGIKNGYGALYPDVVETLIQFKKNNIKLFIASNGIKEYIEGVLIGFRIEHFFDEIYSADEYGIKVKADLVKILKGKHIIKNGAMVGDRSSDIEAGRLNGLFTIGCKYGFNTEEELKGANVIIDNFSDIKDYVFK